MSLLAERSVIGALMLDADISQISTKLKPEMFTDNILSAIYSEYLKGYENDVGVNLVTLDEAVDQSIPRETLRNELFTCADQAVTSEGLESYAQVVINDYKAAQANTAIQHTPISGADVQEKIKGLISELESLSEDFQNEEQTLSQVTNDLKDSYGLEEDDNKIYLGFAQLDNKLCGIEGGDMVLIGARPSVGKSAFAAQIAMNLARQGKKVGFFSLEMTEKQLFERFLAAESELKVSRIRRAQKFNANEKEKYDRAIEELKKYNNLVISSGIKSVSEIRARCKHSNYDVIIIDYMQLIKPESQYRGNRYAEVGAISHAIKGLAIEFDIPVIALSQLNRLSEQRDTKEPTMSEIRESGDIEQDANTIILLWNKDESDKGLKGCKIEKQRQGITGSVTLRFDGDKMHFEEMPNDDVPFEY